MPDFADIAGAMNPTNRALQPGYVPRIKQRGRLWSRLCALAAMAVIIPFLVGFLAFATIVSGYEQPSAVGEADAIIVLTGGQARLGPAVALLSGGRGERLLISGVNPATSKEAIRAATGGAASLFECCVDLDHMALDTIGNAAESAKWIDGNGYRRVIVVTSNYHMPRSLMELGRHAPDVVFTPFAIVAEPRDVVDWLSDSEALRVLVTEYGKYLAALVRPV